MPKGLIRSVLNITITCNAWDPLLHKPTPDPCKQPEKGGGVCVPGGPADICQQPFLNFAGVQQWLMGTMVHEKLTSILEETQAKFLKFWAPG